MKKNRGKLAKKSTSATRRDSRPGAHSASSNERGNDDRNDRKPEEMKEELPSLDENRLCAQLRLDKDENLVIDEKSVLIPRTEVAQLSTSPPITEEGYPRVNFKKGMESKKWFPKETEHFLKTLNMTGTDFFLMGMLFPGRNRAELKKKYVKESKRNPNLLKDCMKYREPIDEEKIKAGPQRMKVGNMDPGSAKKTIARSTEAAKSSKRKAAYKQMDDSTTGLVKKRLFEIGKNVLQPVQNRPTIVPRISNVVASFSVGTELDLSKIVVGLFNAEYNPSLRCATLHLGEPKTSANVFYTGSVSCAGAKTIDSARQATRIYASLIKVSGFPQVEYLNFKVDTIAADYKCKFAIAIEELAKENSDQCHYAPGIFPAAFWNMKDPKVTFKIFGSGCIGLTGGKTMKGIYQAYQQIYQIVEKYKKC